jgi:hypothetical protein
MGQQQGAHSSQCNLVLPSNANQTCKKARTDSEPTSTGQFCCKVAVQPTLCKTDGATQAATHSNTSQVDGPHKFSYTLHAAALQYHRYNASLLAALNLVHCSKLSAGSDRPCSLLVVVCWEDPPSCNHQKNSLCGGVGGWNLNPRLQDVSLAHGLHCIRLVQKEVLNADNLKKLHLFSGWVSGGGDQAEPARPKGSLRQEHSTQKWGSMLSTHSNLTGGLKLQAFQCIPIQDAYEVSCTHALCIHTLVHQTIPTCTTHSMLHYSSAHLPSAYLKWQSNSALCATSHPQYSCLTNPTRMQATVLHTTRTQPCAPYTLSMTAE